MTRNSGCCFPRLTIMKHHLNTLALLTFLFEVLQRNFACIKTVTSWYWDSRIWDVLWIPLASRQFHSCSDELLFLFPPKSSVNDYPKYFQCSGSRDKSSGLVANQNQILCWKPLYLNWLVSPDNEIRIVKFFREHLKFPPSWIGSHLHQ